MSDDTCSQTLCQDEHDRPPTRERAAQYHERGIAVTPVDGKDAILPNWPNVKLSLEQLGERFHPSVTYPSGQTPNIGGLMGEPSGGIVDVDCDAPEVVTIASDFLPPTDAVFGRPSKPRSHWQYTVTLKTKKFVDPTKDKDAKDGMLVEIRSTGAQTVLPGSTHVSGEPIEWDSGYSGQVPHFAEVDPAVLLRKVSMLAVAALLARHYPPKGQRYEFERALSGGLLRGGVTPEDAIAIIDGAVKAAGVELDGSTADTVSRSAERIAAAEDVAGWPSLIGILGEHGPAIVNAVCKWLGIERATALHIAPENFYAYLPSRRYIHRPTGAMWEPGGVATSVGRIEVGTNSDGDTIYMRATNWLDTHRPVHQMTWAPGQPELIENMAMSEGGLHDSPGGRIYNRYRPPLPPTGDPSKAGPWLDHLARLYPDDAAHIVAWKAHRVQRPGEKINHAMVLGGAPGIGKDSALEPVVTAVGPWNFGDVSPSVIVGRFNPFLRNVILRVSEARDLGEVNRYGLYEHMKTIIAAPPDTLRIDEKYLGEYRIPNVVGIVYTTNNRTTGLYLPPDDRRHYVAWSDEVAVNFSERYFDDLYRWYREGGEGHVHAYLMAYDLSAFDPKAPPPKTAAFWAMVDASRAPEESELADVLDALGTKRADEGIDRPKAVTLAAIIAKLAEKHTSKSPMDGLYDALTDRKNRTRIPHWLAAEEYVPVRNPDATDGLWRIADKRQAVYARRDLSVREQVAAARGVTR